MGREKHNSHKGSHGDGRGGSVHNPNKKLSGTASVSNSSTGRSVPTTVGGMGIFGGALGLTAEVAFEVSVLFTGGATLAGAAAGLAAGGLIAWAFSGSPANDGAPPPPARTPEEDEAARQQKEEDARRTREAKEEQKRIEKEKRATEHAKLTAKQQADKEERKKEAAAKEEQARRDEEDHKRLLEEQARKREEQKRIEQKAKEDAAKAKKEELAAEKKERDRLAAEERARQEAERLAWEALPPKEKAIRQAVELRDEVLANPKHHIWKDKVKHADKDPTYRTICWMFKPDGTCLDWAPVSQWQDPKVLDRIFQDAGLNKQDHVHGGYCAEPQIARFAEKGFSIAWDAQTRKWKVACDGCKPLLGAYGIVDLFDDMTGL